MRQQKNYSQEKIFIRSADWISVVNLIDLNSFQYCAHHELPHDFQRKFRRVELVDDWYRFTGNTLCYYLWYIRGRTMEGLSQKGSHAQTC